MVFQPIVRLDSQRVIAHEALMRPHGQSPLALLDAARGFGRLGELETLAVRRATFCFDFAHGGLLFLNLSAHAVL